MKINLKKIIVSLIGTLLLFFYIYGMKFSFLPFGIGKIIVILLSPIILISIFQKKIKLFNEDFLKVFYFLFFTLIYSLFITIINNHYDYSISYIYFLQITEFFIGSLFISTFLFYYLKSDFDKFLLYLTFAIALQSFFIYLCLFNYNFKEFTLFLLPPSGNIDFNTSFRLRGFTNGSGANLSIIQSIGVLSSCILSYKYFKYRVFFLALMLFILFSIIFVGRTGFFLSLFFILLLVLILKHKIVTISEIILLIFIISMLFCLFFPEDIFGLIENRILPWLISLTNKSSSGISNTISILFHKMIVFPDTVIKTMLFGDGCFKINNFNYLNTDLGYLRILLYFGIIMSLIIYLFYFILFYKSYKLSVCNYNKLFILFFFLLLFLVQFKEPFLLKPMFSKIIYLIFTLQVISNKTSKLNRFKNW